VLQHKGIRLDLSSRSTLIHVRNGTRATTRALSNLGQCPWQTVSTQADSAGSIPVTRSTRERRYADSVTRMWWWGVSVLHWSRRLRRRPRGLRPVPPFAARERVPAKTDPTLSGPGPDQCGGRRDRSGSPARQPV